MRLLLVCAGRLKTGPERDLSERYIERAAAAGRSLGFSAIEQREVEESRARHAPERCREEAAQLQGWTLDA